MKITDVRTAVVEANYDWTFIRVYTDEGTTGLGESFLAPGLTQIVRDLKPLLVGEDLRNVDKLWSKMRWATSGAASSTMPSPASRPPCGTWWAGTTKPHPRLAGRQVP